MTRNIDIQSKEFNVGTVAGVNNIIDNARMEPYELVYAYNIDISDKGMPSRRMGTSKKVVPVGTTHSMWGDNKMCFYVENGVLKRLHEDYTSTSLRTGVANYHMSFCEVNDKYYYSNPSAIGYVHNGVNNLFTAPTEENRSAPLPGQHIEYYNGRLYIARNQTIWYTDVNYFNQVDRRSSFIQLDNEITMMKAVDDGIWVCTGDINRQATHFIQGATRDEFRLKSVAGYGCIEGSDIKVKDGSKVGEGFSGTVIMWASDGGICIGGNSGRFINTTDGKFNTPNRRFGAGLFREENGVAQYITTLWE
jgi:hypothetical protein